VEPEKTPRERASEFIEDLVAPAWQPSRDQILWVIRIVLVLAVLLAILTLFGSPFGISLWAWVKLLIVPVVLAIGGFLFTRSENRSTQAVAERRAQDEALQAYLDQVGRLLLDKDALLRQSEEDSDVRTLARARTLTVLSKLDSDHKAQVVQFVYEAGLIKPDQPVLDLGEANLSGANLSEAVLGAAVLRNRSGANLSGATLTRADLSDAKGVTNEQLSAASYLQGATMPDRQTLKGEKTPNGPTLEDWLKDKKAHEKDGANE
jgi:hypothetical protein